MLAFSLGGSSRERVEVRVHDAVSSMDAEGWLPAHVAVAAGAFSGSFDMSIRLEELSAFRDELSQLSRTLAGEARLRTIEGQLSLRVAGNGRGEVRVLGEARDISGGGNRLEFELAIDQTHVRSTLEQLNALVEDMGDRP